MLRKIIRRELHPKGEYCFQNDGKKLLLIMLMFMQTAAYAGWDLCMDSLFGRHNSLPNTSAARERRDILNLSGSPIKWGMEKYHSEK
jgi:hypothetical protein